MTSTAPHDPLPDDATAGYAALAGSDLDAAAARLRAWRARPEVEVGVPAPVPDDDDDLAERLVARRSARHVAAVYTAAHGHPLAGAESGESETGRRRWHLGLRAAVVASVIVLLVGIVASALALARPGDVITLAGADDGSGVQDVSGASPAAESALPEVVADGGADGSTDGSTDVVVHVVGAVGDPGLVTVPAGARVADAIEAAGGATREADTAALNLAREVVDGEQVVVPEPGEVLAPVPDVGGGGAASTSEPGAGPGVAVLDLNAASATELDALPGIGPVLAERIVAWRTEHGPFADVEELDEVSGIGPAVLERLRDLVRV